LQSSLDAHHQSIQNLHDNIESQHQQSLKQVEKIDDINEQLTHIAPQLVSLEQQQQTLAEQYQSIEKNQHDKTGEISALKEQISQQLSKQSLDTLLSAQKNTQALITEQFDKQLPDYLSEYISEPLKIQQEQQKNLITPLSDTLKALEYEIDSIKDAQNQQQTLIQDNLLSAQYEQRLQTIEALSDQFKTQLHDSKKEIKEHIQSLRNADNDNNNKQVKQFNEQLDVFSEQLSHVIEQSNQLQTHFHDIQTQQNTDQEQNNELSKQFLTQQQQLEQHKTELLEFKPIHSETQKQTQQLSIISKIVEQLTAFKNEAIENENKLQSNLVSIAQQVKKNNTATQLKNEQIIQIQQQNQSDNEKQLGNLTQQVNKRSQLFTLGLLAGIAGLIVLAVNIDSLLPEQTHSKNALREIASQLEQNQKQQIQQSKVENQHLIEQQFTHLNQQAANQKLKSDSNNDNLEKWRLEQQIQQEDIRKDINQLSKSMDSLAAQWLKIQEIQRNKNSSIGKSRFSSSVNTDDFEHSTITNINSIKEPFYTIQLLGALNKDSIIDFVKKHALADSSEIIESQYQNKPWYILIQGHYSSFFDAKKQLPYLPVQLQKNKAWIKKIP